MSRPRMSGWGRRGTAVARAAHPRSNGARTRQTIDIPIQAVTVSGRLSAAGGISARSPSACLPREALSRAPRRSCGTRGKPRPWLGVRCLALGGVDGSGAILMRALIVADPLGALGVSFAQNVVDLARVQLVIAGPRFLATQRPGASEHRGAVLILALVGG